MAVRRYCTTRAIGKGVSYRTIQCDRTSGPSKIPTLQPGEKFVVELEPQNPQLDTGLYIMENVAEVLSEIRRGVFTHVYSWGILTEID